MNFVTAPGNDFSINGEGMTDWKQLRIDITELLLSQKLAVLATKTPEGLPYASLIAFAATEDLQKIVLATPKATRKFTNVKHNPGVALLVDDRSNRANDFHDAKALTVLGAVDEIDMNTPPKDLTLLYLNKHPYLESFLQSPSTAFISISVWKYSLVRRFQEVMELHIKDENNLSII